MSTVMIYAAAFHIFHCFQVFGSICKIKFVMRPTVPSPASAAFTTPLDAHPAFLRAQPESTHMADRPISIARFNLCAEIRRRFFFVFFLFFFFYDPRKLCFLYFAPKSILLYCSFLFLFLFFSTLCLLDCYGGRKSQEPKSEDVKNRKSNGFRAREIHFHRWFRSLLSDGNTRPKRMAHKLFALTGHFQIGWRVPRHMDSSRIDPRFSSENGNFIGDGGDCQRLNRKSANLSIPFLLPSTKP